MKKVLFIIFILHKVCVSQTIPTYWIEFTDKNNSPYSISQPEQYLSERTIDRRTKYSIPVLENDLPVNPNYVDSLLQFADVSVVGTSRWFNAALIQTGNMSSLSSVINLSVVKGFRLVKAYVKDTNDKLEQLSEEKSEIDIFNIPHYPYGYSYNQLALHNAYQLQDMGFKGQGIHIAIIDAGFYRANEIQGLSKLFDDERILSTYDFVENNTSVYEDHYHGSAVLSIIGGKIDGVYQGAAPKASFHLLRSEDAFSETILEEFNWIRAAEYADSAGVDIINTSLGYTTFDDSIQNHTYSELNGDSTYIARAADLAAAKGILVIVSAGNSGDSEWQYIGTPADADSVIAVAAVDSIGNRAFFSSKGPASDGSIKPNVSSVGWNTYLLSPWNDIVIRGNGTSFSAPMIAGMSAVLWQALPDKSNMELKKLIEESSSQYSSPDSLLGYGIPNFYQVYLSETNVVYVPVQESGIDEVYPNPASSVVNVIFKSNTDQSVTVELVSEDGKVVESRQLDIYRGKNMIITGLTKAVKGVYTFSVTDEQGGRYAAKIVVI